MGLFVVKPELQGLGVGRELLREAEAMAQRDWGVTKVTMTVITIRPELIAYHGRRGNRRTGGMFPVPLGPSGGLPRVDGLQLEVLEKHLR